MNTLISFINSILGAFGMNFGEPIIKMVLCSVFLVCMVPVVVYAFFGYKLYKISIAMNGAIIFGLIGYIVSAFMFSSFVLPLGIDLPAVIGLVSAGLGAIIAHYLFRFNMMVIGIVLGFVLGSFVVLPMVQSFAPALLESESAKYWIVGACLFLCAALFVICYRFVFIFFYSVVGMTSVSVIAGAMIFPASGFFALILFAIIGLVIGIFAAIHQYRTFSNVRVKIK